MFRLNQLVIIRPNDKNIIGMRSQTLKFHFFDVNTSLKSDRHMGYQDGNGDVTLAG